MPTGSRPRPSGPSDRAEAPGWRQLRRGALLLAGLAVVALAVFFLDDVTREIAAGPTVVVAAPEARELIPGAAVWISGVPAGRVTRIRFRPMAETGTRPVLIRAELRPDAARLLRADASASIQVPALLEPAVLAIEPGRSPAPFDPADTLGAEPGVDPDDLLSRADSLAERLDALRPLARRLARRLEDGPGSLASLREDTAGARRLRETLRRGAGLARSAGEGSGALLAADSTLAARWDAIRTRAGRVTAGAGEGIAVVRELDRIARRLAGLEVRLDSASGSLGRFVHDDALRRERRLLEARLDSVRSELLAEPLRWLRFQLF